MYSERIGHDKWPGCRKRDEMLARKSAKYLKKHYPDSSIICLKGKGHCETTLFEPMEMVKELDKILA